MNATSLPRGVLGYEADKDHEGSVAGSKVNVNVCRTIKDNFRNRM